MGSLGAPLGGRGGSIWIDKNSGFSVPAGPRQRNDRRHAGKRQRGVRRREKTKVAKSFGKTRHFLTSSKVFVGRSVLRETLGTVLERLGTTPRAPSEGRGASSRTLGVTSATRRSQEVPRSGEGQSVSATQGGKVWFDCRKTIHSQGPHCREGVVTTLFDPSIVGSRGP